MRGKERHTFDMAFVLVLAGVFVCAVLFTLLFGTKIYRTMDVRAEQSYDTRTGLSYIAQKLRHADVYGAVRLTDFDGTEAICICEEYGGVDYETRIYVSGGYLRELFCEADLLLTPDAGERILEASAVSFAQPETGLYEIRLTDRDGSTESLYVFLRSGGIAP